MNTNRTRMLLVLVMAVGGLALQGCAMIQQTTIRRLPDGAIQLTSGKDVSIEGLKYQDNETILEIERYSSNINVEAERIRAQAVGNIVEKVITGAGKAAKPIP